MLSEWRRSFECCLSWPRRTSPSQRRPPLIGILLIQCVHNRTREGHARLLQLVILRNAPIAIIEDKMYRTFSKFNVKFSRKMVNEVLLCFVELVEKSITGEMKKTKVAVMHDGWTYAGIHYAGLFAVYVHQARSIEKGTPTWRSHVASPLLSIIPTYQLCQCVSGEACVWTEERRKFDAATHSAHIRTVFQIFDINFNEWIVC